MKLDKWGNIINLYKRKLSTQVPKSSPEMPDLFLMSAFLLLVFILKTKKSTFYLFFFLVKAFNLNPPFAHEKKA